MNSIDSGNPLTPRQPTSRGRGQSASLSVPRHHGTGPGLRSEPDLLPRLGRQMSWRKTWLLGGALLLAASHGAVAQPLIKTQPTKNIVSIGATAQFKVSVISTNLPITYQWWFKESALDPAANPSAGRSTLSLTNVSVEKAGGYFVV